MIKNNNINYNNFKLDDNNNIIIKSNNKNLELGTYVKVLIKATKMNNNDDKIGTLCYLIDIASQADINNFYEKKNRTEDLNDIINNNLSDEESSDENSETIDEIDELETDTLKNKDDESDSKNFIVI